MDVYPQMVNVIIFVNDLHHRKYISEMYADIQSIPNNVHVHLELKSHTQYPKTTL